MKKVLHFISVITFLLASCKPIVRYCCTVAQPSAEMTAQKNNVLWKPQAVAGTLSAIDSLIINATSILPDQGSFTKLDTLCLKISFGDNGTYKLSGSQVFYGTFGQNNLITAYNLDPSFDNELTITGKQNLDNPYTTAPNEVKITGTFNIRLIDPDNAAGISLLNGNFFFITTQ